MQTLVNNVRGFVKLYRRLEENNDMLALGSD